jgi:ABC-type uncharacterized transport system substrate-binding protein
MTWSAQAIAQSGVDVILCMAGAQAIRAAQQATTTVPIVGFTEDMAQEGFIGSLAKRSGNTTGISVRAVELDGKRQEILMEFFPAARHLAALADRQTSTAAGLRALEDAARASGVTLSLHVVERSEDIDPAIEAAKREGAEALNVLASPLLHGDRLAIIRGTAAVRLPAIYQWPDTAREGGLIGYGPQRREVYRQWARQLAKVLRGANAAELPVEQPTTFHLVLNLQTAKALGLELAPTLLARADEVIE